MYKIPSPKGEIRVYDSMEEFRKRPIMGKLREEDILKPGSVLKVKKVNFKDTKVIGIINTAKIEAKKLRDLKKKNIRIGLKKWN